MFFHQQILSRCPDANINLILYLLHFTAVSCFGDKACYIVLVLGNSRKLLGWGNGTNEFGLNEGESHISSDLFLFIFDRLMMWTVMS